MESYFLIYTVKVQLLQTLLYLFSEVKHSCMPSLMKSLFFRYQARMGAAPTQLAHTESQQDICSWLA